MKHDVSTVCIQDILKSGYSLFDFGLIYFTYFGSKLWRDPHFDFNDTTDLSLYIDRLRHWNGPNIDHVINFCVKFYFLILIAVIIV